MQGPPLPLPPPTAPPPPAADDAPTDADIEEQLEEQQLEEQLAAARVAGDAGEAAATSCLLPAAADGRGPVVCVPPDTTLADLIQRMASTDVQPGTIFDLGGAVLAPGKASASAVFRISISSAARVAAAAATTITVRDGGFALAPGQRLEVMAAEAGAELGGATSPVASGLVFEGLEINGSCSDKCKPAAKGREKPGLLTVSAGAQLSLRSCYLACGSGGAAAATFSAALLVSGEGAAARLADCVVAGAHVSVEGMDGCLVSSGGKLAAERSQVTGSDNCVRVQGAGSGAALEDCKLYGAQRQYGINALGAGAAVSAARCELRDNANGVMAWSGGYVELFDCCVAGCTVEAARAAYAGSRLVTRGACSFDGQPVKAVSGAKHVALP